MTAHPAALSALAILLVMLFAGDVPPAAAPPAAGPAQAPVATTRPKDPPVDSKIERTDEEWKRILTPEQYRVLRKEGTERAFTGKLWDEHRPGRFLCAGCGNPLFAAEHKFDSGTGWPSFWKPIEDGRTATREDRSWFSVRTEVHCDRCGGHLGHVFDDGPKPTGQRYCINSAALAFEPAGEAP